MKKLAIVAIAVILLLVMGCFFFIYGNPSKIAQIEKDVMEYLVDQKGINQNDISSIEGGYEWMKSTSYYTKVVFADEPNEWYMYSHNKDGKIYLYSASHLGEHDKSKE